MTTESLERAIVLNEKIRRNSITVEHLVQHVFFDDEVNEYDFYFDKTDIIIKPGDFDQETRILLLPVAKKFIHDIINIVTARNIEMAAEIEQL